MNDNGYIYILINASMPGLLKVGKTTRMPQERAEELSNSTGIPTPFIVAYSKQVNNCTKAEEYVHTYLNKNGYRISNNREFFNAPMDIVIDAILEYRNNFNNDIDDNEIDNKKKIDNTSNMYKYYEELGDDSYYGLGETLQDYNKALAYYKDACKIGSIKAYKKIGDMYRFGEGVQEDFIKSLEYYNRGLNAGDGTCYGSMMVGYFNQDNIDNALKCWNQYAKYMMEDSLRIFIIKIYFLNVAIRNLKITQLDKLFKFKDELLTEYEEGLKQYDNKLSQDYFMEEDISIYVKYVFNNKSENILSFKEGIENYNVENENYKYYERRGDYYCDDECYDKMYDCYIKACELGSIDAYKKLGDIYGDKNQKLYYYSLGAKAGNVTCYASMMNLYFSCGDIDNAIKNWNKYAHNMMGDINCFFVIINNYFPKVISLNLKVTQLEELLKIKDELMIRVEANITALKNNGSDPSLMENILEYIKYIFSDESDNTLLFKEYTEKKKREAYKQYLKNKFKM